MTDLLYFCKFLFSLTATIVFWHGWHHFLCHVKRKCQTFVRYLSFALVVSSVITPELVHCFHTSDNIPPSKLKPVCGHTCINARHTLNYDYWHLRQKQTDMWKLGCALVYFLFPSLFTAVYRICIASLLRGSLNKLFSCLPVCVFCFNFMICGRRPLKLFQSYPVGTFSQEDETNLNWSSFTRIKKNTVRKMRVLLLTFSHHLFIGGVFYTIEQLEVIQSVFAYYNQCLHTCPYCWLYIRHFKVNMNCLNFTSVQNIQ